MKIQEKCVIYGTGFGEIREIMCFIVKGVESMKEWFTQEVGVQISWACFVR